MNSIKFTFYFLKFFCLFFLVKIKKEWFLPSYINNNDIQTDAALLSESLFFIKRKDSINNLVIGVALNYDINKIKVFVESFRSHHLNDSVILVFDDNVNQETIRYLNQNSIDYYIWTSHLCNRVNLMNSRFQMYLEILQIIKNKPKNIYLTDVRDVVFQGNLFEGAHIKNDYIYFFLEDDGKIVRDCAINSFWIKYAFGSIIYKNIYKKRISCAGTVLGSYKEILIYLLLQRFYLKKIMSRSLIGSHVNSDQGIHNYICYCDNILENKIISYSNDIVATIGYSDTANISISDFFYYKKIKPILIHQYDRIKKVNEYFSNKYYK